MRDRPAKVVSAAESVLGEGTGAALAFQLIDVAVHVRDEMATFASAAVSGAVDGAVDPSSR